MSLTDLTWLALAAYGLHILEEYSFDWRDWARNVLALPVEWNDFYITNALVIVLGAVAAELARTQPTLALAFPALMLINATFFHVGPFLTTRGRFSPGLITAVILFYPIGIACFRGSGRASVGVHIRRRHVDRRPADGCAGRHAQTQEPPVFPSGPSLTRRSRHAS